jgi:hypothetical protein
MATINTIDGGPSHEREGPSFVLVRGVERATGIEPAWPAWKIGQRSGMTSANADLRV